MSRRSAGPNAASAVQMGALASSLGVGMVAGVVGTGVMTLSTALEAHLRSRTARNTPARAASAVLGVAPVDERGERRFNHLVHWGYGAAWGTVHGLLASIGLPPWARIGVHGAAVWGAEQIVLPATGVSGPASSWTTEETLWDLWHHGAYAIATGFAYRWLERR